MVFKKNNRGTVTIYLVISFAAILLFIGLFVDLARIKVAQYQTRRILNTAARSVMADYNSLLRREYGLFSVNQESIDQKFQKYMQVNLSMSSNQNLNLLDFQYVGQHLVLSNPLASRLVLKQQILEDQKYKAPVLLTSELVKKIKAFGQLTNFGPQAEQGEKTNLEDKLERIRDNNRTIKELKQEVQGNQSKLKEVDKDLAELNQEIQQSNLSPATLGQKREELDKLRQQRAKYAAEVERLDQEIAAELDSSKQLIREIEDQLPNARQESVSNPTPSAPVAPPLTSEEQKFFQQQVSDQTKYAELSKYYQLEQIQASADNLDEANTSKLEAVLKQLRGIFQLINLENKLIDFRDEIYINEYALNYFSNLALPRGVDSYNYRNLEVEYIIFGQPEVAPQILKAKAVSELYLTRFALDFAVYFAYSKVPGELAVRTVYCLVRGAWQAGIDTFRLLNGQDVAIAEFMGENPLNQIRLTYQDHLRLFLLLHQGREAEKLDSMIYLITYRNQIPTNQAYTLLTGSVELSMKLWFLPLAGVENASIGPFGTKIKNGRCYLVKQVEYGY